MFSGLLATLAEFEKLSGTMCVAIVLALVSSFPLSLELENVLCWQISGCTLSFLGVIEGSSSLILTSLKELQPFPTAEKFQDVITTAIGDIPSVKNISDDVIIDEVNTEEHHNGFHTVLTCFEELNLTLKNEKRQIYKLPIEFLGMVVSADSMSPDPAKVEAIKQAEARTSVSHVRSLLGMTNYVARFKRGYADIVAPLRDLTHKGVEYKWEDVHQQH